MAAALTALIVTGFAFASGGMIFNPGPLNGQSGPALGGVNSHAEIAGRCNQCHAPFWGDTGMAERCETCHTDVAAQWTNPARMHGALRLSNPDATCRNCHPDHRGLNAPMTDMGAFHFSHESQGYSLKAHQFKSDRTPFACTDCHTRIDLSQFDVTACKTCHAQIDNSFTSTHTLTFGNDCLACHDGLDTYGNNFDHNKFIFPLTGLHAQVACSNCHIGARSPEDLQATAQDCFSCHSGQDTHQGRLGSDCGSCHTPAGWSPAPFDHNLATFKLEGKHVGVDCSGCHVNHILQGTPSDCFSCHQKDDKHNNQFGVDCALCHTTAGWLPVSVNHDLFAFKLTGKHIRVECSGCHVTGDFTSTPSDCFSCHQRDDKHNNQFGVNCALCHTTAGWLPVNINHDLFTFKLTGRHASVACTGCHVNGDFKSTPRDCFSCHQQNDNHNGRFGRNCAACHSTSGWLPATFDHNLSRFPLTGAHLGLNCTQCHGSGNFQGLSTVCAACHAEPAIHAGVFGTDCAQCHNTSNWNASFSHPGGCGGNCINHEHATCQDCHTVNYSSATCTKCHDSNNPGGGD